MLATALVLSVLGSLSYDLFFALSLIGLLIITDVTAPLNVSPTWRSRLKWFIALGVVGFGILVLSRMVEILVETGVLT